jgi:hypothetical protein
MDGAGKRCPIAAQDIQFLNIWSAMLFGVTSSNRAGGYRFQLEAVDVEKAE